MMRTVTVVTVTVMIFTVTIKIRVLRGMTMMNDVEDDKLCAVVATDPVRQRGLSLLPSKEHHVSHGDSYMRTKR